MSDVEIRVAARSDMGALVPLVEQYWRFAAIEGFGRVPSGQGS